MKQCTKCHRILPESEFYVRRDNNTLQSQCKDCCKAHGRLRNGTTGIYKNPQNQQNMSNVYAKVETITPVLAAEYLAQNKVNRPLNKKTVDFYAEQMRKGQWRVNGEAICFARNGDMVNGQHRLNAIIQYGKPVDILVVRNCDDDSFATYDSGRNRKASDVFALFEVPDSVNVAAAANKYLKLHMNLSFAGYKSSLKQDKKISNADILDEYKSSPELYRQALSFAKSCYRKMKILPVSDTVGLYVYLIKDLNHPSEVVEAFFSMLFLNENIINSTIPLLRDKLINDRISRQRMTAKYRSMLIIKTWNAYVTGKELSLLKWNEATEGRLHFI